jgi:phosphatidylglycerophosphatase A
MSRNIATVWGIGYLPFAPGTWGSLAGLSVGFMMIGIGGFWLLLIATLAVSYAGWWACERHAIELGEEDPGEIVIDEVAGQWIALLPASYIGFEALVAFLFFRAADIGKPWPASWADQKLPGGLGIMADDWIAGAYAALALWSLKLTGVL